MKFNELNLNEDLLKGIDELGFEKCTEVQERTFKHTLNFRDVCVQSQTGTGKTATFLISAFQNILTNEKFAGKKALILAPTRELAIQIEEEAKKIGKHLNLKTGCFYGGVSYNKQEKSLIDGVDIIIGTPGRLFDFMSSGKMKVNDVTTLIIDEADRLLDMGFLPDIKKILKKLPDYRNRHTMLFSATLSLQSRNIAWEHMNDPEMIEIAPEEITVTKIKQVLFHVSKHEKMNLLLGILKRENPKNVLIFTNMKHSAVEVSQRLNINGITSSYLTGDLPQSKRLRTIDDFKNGKIKILVATDVAGRGIHIEDLELVINYQLPEHSENYVHRIGRTARAGKTGKAISLACEKFIQCLEPIEHYIEMEIPIGFADENMYIEDKSERTFFNSDNKRKTSRSKTEKRAIDRANGYHNQSHKKGIGRNIQVKKHPKNKLKRPTANSTPEERIAYYKQKYGDNFVLNQSKKTEQSMKKIVTKKVQQKSFISRILSLFKK